jgi:hypothetical protein
MGLRGVKAPAVAVVILLIVTVMSGCLGTIEQDCECHESMNVSSPKLKARTIGTLMLWDAEIEVYKAYPRCFQDALWWEHCSMSFVSETGEEMMPRTLVEPYPGEIGISVEVAFYIIDMDEPTGAAGRNDTIIITSLDTTFEGARLLIYFKNARAADLMFPEIFPVPEE